MEVGRGKVGNFKPYYVKTVQVKAAVFDEIVVRDSTFIIIDFENVVATKNFQEDGSSEVKAKVPNLPSVTFL